VGVNAVSVNNVNACAHGNGQLLTGAGIAKLAALGQVFDAWGIAVFVVPCYAYPLLHNLTSTADPLDPAVKGFWAAKALEVGWLVGWLVGWVGGGGGG
jgi:alpha-glucuronidase